MAKNPTKPKMTPSVPKGTKPPAEPKPKKPHEAWADKIKGKGK